MIKFLLGIILSYGGLYAGYKGIGMEGLLAVPFYIIAALAVSAGFGMLLECYEDFL